MDVRYRIKSGVYTNTKEYPAQENYEKDREATIELRAEYNIEEARLNHLFRADAIEEVFGDDASRFPGLVNYLYGKAHESGHGSGFNEVLSQLEEYSDIITVIANDLKFRTV